MATKKKVKPPVGLTDIIPNLEETLSPKERSSHSRPPRISRSQAQKARDRAVISREYLRGRSQADIASMLGIDQATVSRDLQSIQQEWLAANLADITNAKVLELHKLDMIETEAWEAWEASKKKKRESYTKAKAVPAQLSTTTAEPGTIQQQRVIGTETQIHQLDNDGDPRFLAVIFQCIQKRAELLGLNAPKLIAPVTPAGDLLPMQVQIYLPDNKR